MNLFTVARYEDGVERVAAATGHVGLKLTPTAEPANPARALQITGVMARIQIAVAPTLHMQAIDHRCVTGPPRIVADEFAESDGELIHARWAEAVSPRQAGQPMSNCGVMSSVPTPGGRVIGSCWMQFTVPLNRERTWRRHLEYLCSRIVDGDRDTFRSWNKPASDDA